MKVYINYINQHKNFLFEELVDDALLYSSTENINIKLNDIFNTKYIKEKLLELLNQKIPGFVNASKEIIELCIYILVQHCKSIIQEISNLIDNINKGIEFIFNAMSNFISKNFEKRKNIIKYKLGIIDETKLDLNKKLIQKIKDFKESFYIPFSNIDKINKICKLEEIQIFAFETEENYICLPFDDEKKFKVIKVANYYDSYFEITDQESNDLLDMLLEHKEKGTNVFKRKVGNMPEFTYEFLTAENRNKFEEQNNIKWGSWPGMYISDQNKIVLKTTLDNTFAYITLVHEFIHYKDDISNKEKFTNRDLNDILTELSTLTLKIEGKNYSFKKDEVFPYNIFKNIIKKHILKNKNADSEARYIISLLQKNKYIDYVDNDFTKIKINFISSYLPYAYKADDNKNKAKNTFYYASPIELNTIFQNSINDFILNEEKIKQNIEKEIEALKKEYAKKDELTKINIDDKYGIFNYFNTLNNKKNIIPFSNYEYKILKKYLDENKTKKDFHTFVSQNDNKPKTFNERINSKFIKSLKFNKEQKIKFTKYLNRYDDHTIINTFISLQDFDENYLEGYILKFHKEKYEDFINKRQDKILDKIKNLEEELEKEKNNIHNIETNISDIFNEMSQENKLKFNTEAEKEKFKNQLRQNYLKKFKEKVEHYRQQRETNKQKIQQYKNTRN